MQIEGNCEALCLIKAFFDTTSEALTSGLYAVVAWQVISIQSETQKTPLTNLPELPTNYRIIGRWPLVTEHAKSDE